MYCPLDYPTKLKIAYFHGQFNTQREITGKTGSSKSSVNRVIQILNSIEETEYKCDLKSQLRYHFVLFKELQNPFITNRQIYKSIQNFEFKISETTISRIVLSLNIKNKYQKPREKLTQLQKNNRVASSQNLLKSELFLFPFVFSDKSMIILEPLRKKIKVCLFSIMMIIISKKKVIRHDFKSPIISIKNKSNLKEYLKILEENNIINLLNERFGNFAYAFQQDGASSHCAKKTIKYLSRKVKLLLNEVKWRANSPNLKVIETL